MTRRLALEHERPQPDTPSALETYRALIEDGGEPGKRIRAVLAQLREDPGIVRGHSLRYRPEGWWAAETEMPNGSTWWTVWRERTEEIVQVRYIGPKPGH